MELFRKLNDALAKGGSVNIVISKQDEDRMVASVLADGGTDLPPVILRGTPAELDEGFTGAILAPVQTAAGLRTSSGAFDKAAAEFGKDGAKTAEAKRPAAKKDSGRKKETPAEKEPAAEAPATSASGDGDDIFRSEREQHAEPAPASETVPAATAAAPAEPEVKEPESPAAPAAPAKSLNELWNEGKALYAKGDYAGARRTFESALPLASDTQRPNIEKAMGACTGKMNQTLFGGNA